MSHQSSRSSAPLASKKMLHLFLQLAWLLNNHCHCEPGMGRVQPPHFEMRGRKTVPCLHFPGPAETGNPGTTVHLSQNGVGEPTEPGKEGSIFPPQRAWELLVEVHTSDKALHSSSDGALSAEYTAASEHPHGAAHRAKLAGRLANIDPRGQAGLIQVPTSNNLPSKIRWSVCFAGKPAHSSSSPFSALALPAVRREANSPSFTSSGWDFSAAVNSVCAAGPSAAISAASFGAPKARRRGNCQ